MRAKLSPKLIEHLKAPGPKRLDAWDTVLQCFGVRVSPNGRKTWFVIVRINSRQKRVTIGTYPAISLAEARGEARKSIRDAQLGLISNLRSPCPHARRNHSPVHSAIRKTEESRLGGVRTASREVPGPVCQTPRADCPQRCSACLGPNYRLRDAIPSQPCPSGS